MNKTFSVIRRELIARVRTRAFLISTLLLPVFFVFVSVVPALMMRGGERTLRLAIVDGSSDGLGQRIESALRRERVSPRPDAVLKYSLERIPAVGRVPALRDSLVSRTGLNRTKEPESLDGVLVVSESAAGDGKFEYLGSNASSFETMGSLERSVSQVLVSSRLERTGVDPRVLALAMKPADLSTIKVSDGKTTGQSGAASFLIAYFMGFVLYIGVVLYGQQTLTSVIEEKTSRIMEVLASSLRPFQMLLGKVLGVGATGLLQMAIWGGTVYMVTSQRARIAALFHVSPDAMQQIPIPTMSADLLAIFLVYFTIGFLIFGAMYAAIGSMCNNIKDAQQYMILVTMVLVFGFFGVFALMKDPTGGLGVALSIIPFVSQFAMPVRWSLAVVPPFELAISLTLAILALLGVTWLAARIYRTGILMYGKKPTIREVLRWVMVK